MQQVCLHLWNNAAWPSLDPWGSRLAVLSQLLNAQTCLSASPTEPNKHTQQCACLAVETGFLGSLLRSGINSCRHLQRPMWEKQMPHTGPSTHPPPRTHIHPPPNSLSPASSLLSYAQDRLEAVDKLSARSAMQRSPGVLALAHPPLINSPASGAFRRGAEGLQVICFNHFRPPEREEQWLNCRPIMTPHLKLSGNQS